MPEWLLNLVPQYGFWAGNGLNDAWLAGQQITLTLGPNNPGLRIPTLDANNQIAPG